METKTTEQKPMRIILQEKFKDMSEKELKEHMRKVYRDVAESSDEKPPPRKY